MKKAGSRPRNDIRVLPLTPFPDGDDVLEGRSGSCSTEYVRGREALRPGVSSKVDIANCNQSVILQLSLFKEDE